MDDDIARHLSQIQVLDESSSLELIVDSSSTGRERHTQYGTILCKALHSVYLPLHSPDYRSFHTAALLLMSPHLFYHPIFFSAAWLEVEVEVGEMSDGRCDVRDM